MNHYPATDTLNFNNNIFEDTMGDSVKDNPTTLVVKEKLRNMIKEPITIRIDQGSRYNKGKIRYDLFEPFAMEQLAKVFTKGAEKYEDRNWEKGMQWSKMEASLMRHFEAYKQGKDFDIDPSCEECKKGTCTNHTGLYHIAQVAWNALGILSYYKLYPQGDNRAHPYLRQPSIGLDIDEVICSWVEGWCAKYNLSIPTAWSFEWDTQEKFKQLAATGELDSFYLSLKPKIAGKDLPFEPTCYISHRPVSTEITQQWLQKHGFPLKPVYTVENRQDKLNIAKKVGLDIFVDDNYDTFVYMNKNGICTYLMDAPHNTRYNVGAKRLFNLKELV